MWVFTKYGFFSITQPSDGREGFQVRSRDKDHLKSLFRHVYGETLSDREISVDPDRDYLFRVYVDSKKVRDIFLCLAHSIDYSNFKDSVHEARGGYDSEYELALHDIWGTMFRYQIQKNGHIMWGSVGNAHI